MGRKCSVEGCLSDSNRVEDIGVTFHKVPLHPDVRPKWMSLCHISEDKKLVKIIYVCSRHFLRADFCHFKGKKYMLKQGVLPSVFPWDKSKLEAIKAEAHIKKDPAEESLKGLIDENTNEKNNKHDIHKEDLGNLPLSQSLKMEISDTELKVEPEEKLDEFQKTKVGQNADNSKFTIDSKVEALDFDNEWYAAKVVEVDYEENEVLIHFENNSNKSDEWIPINSPRLRLVSSEKSAVSEEQFVVGERCLAAWSDSRKFPAIVTKVLENGLYEVLFDDGFVEVLEGNRISKSSPLFNPIKSSKQDRREKKRKLNVAQLFKRKPRLAHSEDKPKKSMNNDHFLNSHNSTNVSYDQDSSQLSNISQEETEPSEIEQEPNKNWKIQWVNGKPVGEKATMDTQDGVKETIIVSDPRLPEGWKKHLLKRTHGQYAGKWDVIIVSPELRKFRSRIEVKKYLDENCLEGVTYDMFDFALGSRRRRGLQPKQTHETDKSVLEETQYSQGTDLEDTLTEVKEEVNENSLKIIYEGDAYKCPIDGCGKQFRKENLAQMHVKHYHPEYTKYLDSTPNVADLAYARTVGERLDGSPSHTKTASYKPTVKTSIPKMKAQQQSVVSDLIDSKTSSNTSSPTHKNKDSEIIKLLNTKSLDKDDAEAIKPLSSGLPTNMYPEINLKDLLNKTEGVPKRDDLNLKTLCSSRPLAGIKTLLPLRQSKQDTAESSKSEEPKKSSGRRKRKHSDHVEIMKGKSNTPQLPPRPPSPQQPSTSTAPPLVTSPIPPQLEPFNTPQPSTSTPSTSQPQPEPPNNIIIEGGEVIKIVRMKQEEIINCTCGFTEEDGLMIQCELCLCWQHAYCNNIERESQVPEKYICYICQNPLRERLSRKYYHDQDWLKQGILPVANYHTKDEQILQQRFDKLKKCNDVCGGLLELRDYMHSLAVKMKIAKSKNHPKLYLWSTPWDKSPLPEKINQQNDEMKPKSEESDLQDFEKDDDKSENPNDSMLMMILKAGKEDLSKIDLNTLMDPNEPIIPQPKAAIDLADCKLNLLDHILHQESLVEERLEDFERQLDALEEGMNMELHPDYPKTRETVQLLMRDLDTMTEFSECTTI